MFALLARVITTPRNFGPPTFHTREVSVQGRVGPGTFWSQIFFARNISIPGRFGPDIFRFRGILANGYFGSRSFWPQDISLPGLFRLRTFGRGIFWQRVISVYGFFWHKDISVQCHFAPGILRSQVISALDISLPEQLGWDISVPGHFGPWTFRSWHILIPGCFCPKYFRSLDASALEHFSPVALCPWTFCLLLTLMSRAISARTFWSLDVLLPGHRRFGLGTFRSLDISATGHFRILSFRPLDISQPGLFGQGTFQSRNVSVLGHFAEF